MISWRRKRWSRSIEFASRTLYAIATLKWRHDSPHSLPRPLRALAHRPAAYRLAGGRHGQLPGRQSPPRPVAGAHRRRRRRPQRGRRRPAHPGLLATLWHVLGRRRQLAKPPHRPVPASLAAAGRTGLSLRLLAQGNRRFAAEPDRPPSAGADLPRHLPPRPRPRQERPRAAPEGAASAPLRAAL